MLARVRSVLIAGLIFLCVACGEAEKPWVPVCFRLPTTEAERIIADGGPRLNQGPVGGSAALRGEETYRGRAVWAVILDVGDTRLVLLHDTDPTVASPNDEGWSDGEWRSHDARTRQLLSHPLNSSSPHPFPESVVEEALAKCDLSVLPF